MSVAPIVLDKCKKLCQDFYEENLIISKKELYFDDLYTEFCRWIYSIYGFSYKLPKRFEIKNNFIELLGNPISYSPLVWDKIELKLIN